MSPKLHVSIVFLLAVLLFGVESAFACKCFGDANPCAFFRSAGGVAFIGTVTEVVDANEKYGQPIKGTVRKITIKVDEVFKGTLPDVVVTSDDGFRCDNYPFKLGISYLIYSKGVLENTTNILPVGLCSGTAPVEAAEDAIRFLRQMKNGIMPSILYGRVLRVVNGQTAEYQPLANTKVIATKLYYTENGQRKEPKKKERETVTLTNEKGEYKFENLQPAVYRFRAVLPGDLWMQEYWELGTGGSPSCDSFTLHAFTNGSISGTVLNPDGSPARVAVMISPVDRTTRYFYHPTPTDEKGNFTFKGLNEGRYLIYTNLPAQKPGGTDTNFFGEDFPFKRYYYPNAFLQGDAEAVTLGYAQTITNISLKLPSAPTKKSMSGIVVWPDGKPVTKAVISYRVKDFGEFLKHIYAKEDGTFTISFYEGLAYELFSSGNSSAERGAMLWTALNEVESNGQLKVVLTPTK